MARQSTLHRRRRRPSCEYACRKVKLSRWRERYRAVSHSLWSIGWKDQAEDVDVNLLYS
jgi:endogenous inhibitor of DNA gyrase (YacG/DUF329 family)